MRRRRLRRRVPTLLLLVVSLGDVHANGIPGIGGEADCPASLAPTGQCGVDPGAQGSGPVLDATDPGAAPPARLPSTTLGNPVDLVTGAKRQAEIDYDVVGTTLAFGRHYSSASADRDVGLGRGWRHSYATRLESLPDGGRLLTDSAGRLLRFAPDTPDGLFAARIPSDGYLQRSDGRTTWNVPDGRRLVFNGSFLIRVDWPDQRRLALRYRHRRLVSVTDETGAALGFEYTAGRPGLIGYDPDPYRSHSGYLSALILPDGTRVQYAYDERQNLTRARYPDGTARLYHYEDPLFPNHLTGLTERTGQRVRNWAYDDRGRARLSERTEGIERVTLLIDAPEDRPGGRTGDEGRTIVTDSGGAESVYRWRRDPRTGASEILSATGPGCVSCPPTARRYAYDADRRLSEVARLHDDGTVLGTRHYEHDELDRLVRIVETVEGSDGPRERWLERRAYEGDSSRVAILARPSVNPAGDHVTERRYRPDGLLASVTERGFVPRFDTEALTPSGFEPIEHITRFRYEEGRLVAFDGPRDDVDDTIRFDWDDRRRLVAMRPPMSPALRVLRFDALGRPLEFQVGSRRPVVHAYLNTGRLVRVDEDGGSTHFRHDAEGRLLAITDADGRERTARYDAAGRPVRMTDEDGRVTTRTLDDEGRLIGAKEVGADGTSIRSIEQRYGSLGRLLERTTGVPERHTGDEFVYRRDISRDLPNGRTTSLDTGSGLASLHIADPFGRVRTLIAPDGSRRDYDGGGYRHAPDPLAVVSSFSDARGNVTTYARDDFGRVVMEDSPDTGRVTYRHDAAGNRIEMLDALGRRTSLAWDAADRPLRRQSVDGETIFEHDPASGLMTRATNPTTEETFEHDADGRLVAHTRTLGSRTFTTRYERDDRSRVLAKTLPDGTELRFRYHTDGPNRGELAAIERASLFGLVRTPLVSDIDARSADGTSGHLAADGRRVERRHAPDGAIESIDVGTLLSLRYRHDGAGRVTATVENGHEQRYHYADGRLVEADTLTGLHGYAHDETGNRVARRHVSPAGEIRHERLRYASPGGGNRLLGVDRYEPVDGDAGPTLETRLHDAAGSPTAIRHQGHTRRLVHDAEQRLVEVHENGTLLAEYGYNPFGERVFKRVHHEDGPATTTWFLHDGTLVSSEIDGGDGVSGGGGGDRHYLYLDDIRPVAMLVGGRVHAIQTDHLGAPRVVTSSDGRTAWSARYAPFGRAEVASDAELTLNLRLPGQYADEETGVHYNVHRYYAPDLGRYLTSDPIGLAGGTNTYAYVNGNPLSAIDPLGLRAAGLAAVPIVRPPIVRPGTSPGRRPVARSEGQVIRLDRYTRAEQALRRYRPD